MMIIVVNSLWNEEILERLAFKNRIQNTSIFGVDFGAFAGALNFILCAMKIMSSRNSTHSLIILPNKAQCIVIDKLRYRRIPNQATVVVDEILKIWRKIG
jgi:hypothetical protein